MHLERWALNRPFIIRVIAQDLAISANSLFEVFHYIKNNTNPEQFKQPTIQEWVSFYKGKTDTTNKLISSIHNLGEPSSLGTYLYQRLSGEEVEIPSIFNGLTDEEIYKIHLSGIKEDIANKTLTSRQKKFAEEEILTASFLFHITITVPCQIFWYQKPNDLYKNGIKGDPTALERLFRLDKLIVQHQKISKWLTFYAQKSDPTVIEKLTAAICKPIKEKTSNNTIKYFLSGQISIITEALGHRLEAPEIQSLFDAISADYGRDELRDTDLPDSPEAFSRAINRQRNIAFEYAKSLQ